MYNEQLITSFMPKLIKLAEKHADLQFDFDDVLSEGQIYMLDYLQKHQNEPVDEHNLYCSVDHRLKTFVTNKKKKKDEEDVIPIDTLIVIDTDHNSEGVESFLSLIKSFLTEREFDIIAKSFGVYTISATFADIAKEYNLSVNRIKQIRDKAIVKIRVELAELNITCPEDLF